MSNATFEFVEDYIEYIGGYRTAAGKSLVFFEVTGTPLSLARYDVKIIDSLSIQTSELNRPYTDKQAELAVKIIKKYERQLNNNNVFLPDALTNYRFGLREVDRTKKLFIQKNKIILKFPYDTKLLPLVKRYSKESDGYAKFDYDAKYWILGFTEPMLNWSVSLARANNFEIDYQIEHLYERMLAVEQTNYKIELCEVDGRFTITNAASSLKDYVTEQLGGFSKDNLIRLLDNASVLGYTVDPALFSLLPTDLDQFKPLIANRQIKLSAKDWNLNRIKQYAIMTDRLPMYAYDSKLDWKESDDVKFINRSSNHDLVPKLLVTNTSMMIGPKKQSWLAKAEKIVILE